MWEHQLSQLRQDGITIPLPNNIKGWEDDVKKWPKITYSSIFSCFLNSAASDGEAMNNLKSSEAYQYLHSNKVGRVLLKEIAGHNLKGDVEPSQSLKVAHHRAWVLVSSSGEIQTAGCSCVAGQGRSCSHAAAILWKVYVDYFGSFNDNDLMICIAFNVGLQQTIIFVVN